MNHREQRIRPTYNPPAERRRESRAGVLEFLEHFALVVAEKLSLGGGDPKPYRAHGAWSRETFTLQDAHQVTRLHGLHRRQSREFVSLEDLLRSAGHDLDEPRALSTVVQVSRTFFAILGDNRVFAVFGSPCQDGGDETR